MDHEGPIGQVRYVLISDAAFFAFVLLRSGLPIVNATSAWQH